MGFFHLKGGENTQREREIIINISRIFGVFFGTYSMLRILKI